MISKNEDNSSRYLEPVLLILVALLKESSQNKKIDSLTKTRLIKTLNKSGFSQESIASILSISLTDVGKVLKKK